MSDVPTSGSPTRPALLLAAVGIAVLEAVALAAYAVGIGVSTVSDASPVAAAPVEIVVYLLFALGIALCALGLWRRRRTARTPFGVIQLFGVVVGWTLTQGDGDLTHRIGYAVLAVSVVGVAVVLSPRLGDALES
ncbi:MAG TPA: hypothetical protein VLV82_01345 [Candidatus Angelobacter sp.]|nr:hypothetical protein [Candidatus Angelobacter sp.]